MGDDDRRIGNLPPGFRFYPTDEELVAHFLHRRAALLPCHPDVIPDLDLCPYDPWDLHGKALSEGRKWYYYSRRTSRRVSESGYWKQMGMEEPILCSSTGTKLGTKKYLMFHLDHPSPSEASTWTNWMMHEYRLSEASSSSSNSTSRRKSRSKLDGIRWVICKVYEQTNDDGGEHYGTELSCLDEVFLAIDDYDEISLPS